MSVKRFFDRLFSAICLCQVVCICPRRKLASESFFNAAIDGNLKDIESGMKFMNRPENKKHASSLLSMVTSSVNSINNWGETPLILACRLGHFKVARYFVTNCRADINQPANIFDKASSDEYTRATPLHAAIMSGNIELVRFLINEHNADVNALSEPSHKPSVYCLSLGGNTPLHYAVYYLKGLKRNAIIRLLVGKGADMYRMNKAEMFSWTLTFDIDIVLPLYIKLGLDVNHRYKSSNETLAHMWARSIHHKSVDIIDQLVMAKADFSVKNGDGLTPIMIAALGKNGKPNTKNFQRIYNSQSHKMTTEEKINAMELIGAIFIIQTNPNNPNHTKYLTGGIHLYWRKAVQLRLCNQTTAATEIHGSSFMDRRDVCEIQDLKELDYANRKCQKYYFARERVTALAIKTVQRILGNDSHLVRKIIQSYEKINLYFLTGIDISPPTI